MGKDAHHEWDQEAQHLAADEADDAPFADGVEETRSSQNPNPSPIRRTVKSVLLGRFARRE
jgi:hypothetical protein